MICEQAPNRESRVTLASERDAFDRPRARLDWRLSELDRKSARRSLELLAHELGRTGIGRGALFLDETAPWRDVITSGHHIGTTRMSQTHEDGVVDADTRVHGIANLFVSSSATFPTSGLASPTPTIVALAVRLADHLKERLA
jgi:choline dehydrogenase-like flavoprotein